MQPVHCLRSAQHHHCSKLQGHATCSQAALLAACITPDVSSFSSIVCHVPLAHYCYKNALLGLHKPVRLQASCPCCSIVHRSPRLNQSVNRSCNCSFCQIHHKFKIACGALTPSAFHTHARMVAMCTHSTASPGGSTNKQLYPSQSITPGTARSPLAAAALGGVQPRRQRVAHQQWHARRLRFRIVFLQQRRHVAQRLRDVAADGAQQRAARLGLCDVQLDLGNSSRVGGSKGVVDGGRGGGDSRRRRERLLVQLRWLFARLLHMRWRTAKAWSSADGAEQSSCDLQPASVGAAARLTSRNRGTCSWRTRQRVRASRCCMHVRATVRMCFERKARKSNSPCRSMRNAELPATCM